MIIDAHKTMSELEELRYGYYHDLQQLDELRARLYAKCSKLTEIGIDKDFHHMVQITESSFEDIGIAMQKLEKALEGTSVLIQKCQAHLEEDLGFNDIWR